MPRPRYHTGPLSERVKFYTNIPLSQDGTPNLEVCHNWTGATSQSGRRGVWYPILRVGRRVMRVNRLLLLLKALEVLGRKRLNDVGPGMTAGANDKLPGLERPNPLLLVAVNPGGLGDALQGHAIAGVNVFGPGRIKNGIKEGGRVGEEEARAELPGQTIKS